MLGVTWQAAKRHAHQGRPARPGRPLERPAVQPPDPRDLRRLSRGDAGRSSSTCKKRTGGRGGFAATTDREASREKVANRCFYVTFACASAGQAVSTGRNRPRHPWRGGVCRQEQASPPLAASALREGKGIATTGASGREGSNDPRHLERTRWRRKKWACSSMLALCRRKTRASSLVSAAW